MHMLAGQCVAQLAKCFNGCRALAPFKDHTSCSMYNGCNTHSYKDHGTAIAQAYVMLPKTVLQAVLQVIDAAVKHLWLRHTVLHAPQNCPVMCSAHHCYIASGRCYGKLLQLLLQSNPNTSTTSRLRFIILPQRHHCTDCITYSNWNPTSW